MGIDPGPQNKQLLREQITPEVSTSQARPEPLT